MVPQLTRAGARRREMRFCKCKMVEVQGIEPWSERVHCEGPSSSKLHYTPREGHLVRTGPLPTCSRRLHAFFYFGPYVAKQWYQAEPKVDSPPTSVQEVHPPRHHLACALRCLVGCGSPNVPIGEALRGQQATKALVSLQRIVRLVRALLPEVSEQLANLN